MTQVCRVAFYVFAYHNACWAMQGTDIKIYVIGPDYAHAEARKSPVVDGIVQVSRCGLHWVIL
jgi:hypothetical protein